MPRLTRPLALLAACGLALAAIGCSGNKDKIVGKWKAVSMTTNDGKEQKLEIMGMTPLMEFTADGNINVGLDTSNMPAEFKEKFGDKNAEKLNEMKSAGKYKVSGDTIEFLDMDKSGDSPLGKNNKGKLKFEGDTLSITGEDGTLKLGRMK